MILVQKSSSDDMKSITLIIPVVSGIFLGQSVFVKTSLLSSSRILILWRIYNLTGTSLLLFYIIVSNCQDMKTFHMIKEHRHTSLLHDESRSQYLLSVNNVDTVILYNFIQNVILYNFKSYNFIYILLT